MPATESFERELANDVARRTGLPLVRVLGAVSASDGYFQRAGAMPLGAAPPVIQEWSVAWTRELVNAGLSPRETASFALCLFEIAREGACEGARVVPPTHVVKPCFKHIAELLEAEATIAALGVGDA